jgi:hypothetical protein
MTKYDFMAHFVQYICMEGGVKIFYHTNQLSENIFQVEFICAQKPWPNIVGGYMREGVSLTQSVDWVHGRSL